MTKIYILGYGTYEESDYTYLLHDDVFTYDEFENMIFESTYKFIMEEKKYIHYYIHSFSDVHSGVVEIMINDYGFKKLEPEVSWACFGWSSIFTTKDWEDDILYTNRRLVEYLRNKGLSEKDDTYLQWEKAR